MNLIYFDPECTSYHPGHVRLFAERAAADERISSLHFVLTLNFRDYDRLNIFDTIQSQPKLLVEYCKQSVADACSPYVGMSHVQEGLICAKSS
jgi:hypothetical protein